ERRHECPDEQRGQHPVADHRRHGLRFGHQLKSISWRFGGAAGSSSRKATSRPAIDAAGASGSSENGALVWSVRIRGGRAITNRIAGYSAANPRASPSIAFLPHAYCTYEGGG